MDLPVYELKINETADSFVDAIALVDSPAIESDFLAFSQQQKGLTFSVDDEKQELIGAAMIPDMKIYRNSPDGGYYVFFSKDTIRNIAQVFFKKGFQGNMNLDHESDKPADSYIYQSYIVDNSKGISGPNGLNLPDGSWVVGAKVDNPDVWGDIKSGKRKGFSVEGIFELLKADFDKAIDKEQAEIRDLLNQLKQIIKRKK